MSAPLVNIAGAYVKASKVLSVVRYGRTVHVAIKGARGLDITLTDETEALAFMGEIATLVNEALGA